MQQEEGKEQEEKAAPKRKVKGKHVDTVLEPQVVDHIDDACEILGYGARSDVMKVAVQHFLTMLSLTNERSFITISEQLVDENGDPKFDHEGNPIMVERWTSPLVFLFFNPKSITLKKYLQNLKKQK